VTLEVTKVPKVERDNRQSSIVNLQFSIEDTGMGIPPEHFETIFQPFQQADPYQLQEGSTGLGLAISQRLVEMMGSQLHVTSTVGEGSTFWFELELAVIEATVKEKLQPIKEGFSDHSSPETLTIALGALPAEWVADLKQGAEEVDVGLLSSVIEQIRGRDAALADALARLVEDFEYDEILAAIRQIEYKQT
jgi:hypothetical protein